MSAHATKLVELVVVMTRGELRISGGTPLSKNSDIVQSVDALREVSRMGCCSSDLPFSSMSLTYVRAVYFDYRCCTKLRCACLNTVIWLIKLEMKESALR